jgi:IPT/TIG domain
MHLHVANASSCLSETRRQIAKRRQRPSDRVAFRCFTGWTVEGDESPAYYLACGRQKGSGRDMNGFVSHVSTLLVATPGKVTSNSGGTDNSLSLIALGGTIGVLAGVAVTLLGVFIQRRQSRTATGLDLLFRMLNQWDSEDMRSRRAEIAEMLLGFRTNGWPAKLDHRHREILDVLNFFEYLGFFVCVAKMVRCREAWSIFYPWACRYWYASTPIRTSLAERSPQSYAQYKKMMDGFLILYARGEVRGIQKLWQKRTRATPASATVDAFLRNEMRLAEVPPLSWRPKSQPARITGISPTSGSTRGGDPVTITGSGFRTATSVQFGRTPATMMQLRSDTEILCQSPQGTGTVDVRVETSTATAICDAIVFTYVRTFTAIVASLIQRRLTPRE